MKARRAPTLLVVAAATSGCLSVSYRARQSPIGDPPSFAARAEAVSTWDHQSPPGSYKVGNDNVAPMVTNDGWKTETGDDDERSVVWSLGLDGGAGADVVAMMWSRPSAPRCQGGHPALDLLLDREVPVTSAVLPRWHVHWERPVVLRGPGVVSGRFHQDPALLHEPSVVDVSLVVHDASGTRDVCVRVPVTGPGISYWNEQKWSPGLRVEVRRSRAFTPGTTFMAGFSLGRWLGPVRLALEGDVGGTNDDNPQKGSPSGTWTCVASPGPNCDSAKFGGFSLEASGMLWRHGPHWGLGWSAAYEAAFASLERIDPTSSAFVSRGAGAGGGRVGLRLLAAAPDLMGVSPHSPTSAWVLELFVAASQEWYGVAGGHPLTFGLAGAGF